MFKKKSKVDDYFDNFLKSLTIAIRCRYIPLNEVKISFDESKELLEKCIEQLTSKKVSRKIDFDYYGFTDTITTTYDLDNLIVSELYNDEALFSKRIETQDEIKNFLNATSLLNEYPDFLYVHSELLNKLKDFDLDLSLFRDIDISNIIEEFQENYEEKDFGLIRNNYPCVGYSYTLYICNKEDVWYNLKLITWYLRNFYENLLKSSYEDKIKVIETIPNIIDNLPIIATSEDLLSCVIAFGDNLTRTKLLNDKTKDNTKLILDALIKNPNCYKFLPANYQNDMEICKCAIKNSISILPSVIENGPIKKSEWEKLIIEFLNTRKGDE